MAIPVEVPLRGELSPARRVWLDALIPSACRGQVYVHPTVPNGELPARIAEHDIGLALEVPQSLNRELTATNKLFQYLQAGLAVVATDTAGQREVLGQHGAAGPLIQLDDPRGLAHAITALLTQPNRLRAAKAAALRTADAFSWEMQEASILTLAERAVAGIQHPLPAGAVGG